MAKRSEFGPIAGLPETEGERLWRAQASNRAALLFNAMQLEFCSRGLAGDTTMKLNRLPRSLLDRLEGPRPPADFECDGCSHSPDFIGGADLRPACAIHDFMYGQGGAEKDRMVADYVFYRNLLACGLSRFWANVYFRRVRLFGVSYFNYRPGQRPRGALFWVRTFFGRFLQW